MGYSARIGVGACLHPTRGADTVYRYDVALCYYMDII